MLTPLWTDFDFDDFLFLKKVAKIYNMVIAVVNILTPSIH